jgi:hypothetical protein
MNICARSCLAQSKTLDTFVISNASREVLIEILFYYNLVLLYMHCGYRINNLIVI